MFINCKKTLEFINPETGEVCRFPRGYLGSVPEWVSKLWYFQAAVGDATITFVGDTPKAAAPAATTETPPDDGDNPPKPDNSDSPPKDINNPPDGGKVKPPVKK